MTIQLTNLSTTCPECGHGEAWHGVAGRQGVHACDECGHSVDFDCPDWCERICHTADRVGPGEPAVHYGPTFGNIATQGISTADLHAVMLLDPLARVP